MKVQDVGCELQKHAQLNFTGCLLFNAESSGSVPHVYFNNGLVYAAQYGSFRGKHALQHILRLPSPTLDERYGETYGHKEMDQPLDELLVEAMQAEWTGTELPEPEPPPVSRLNLGSSGPLRDDGTSPYVFIFFSMKQEWVLDTGRYIIGRSESCHICIPDDSISSFHCVIDIAGGKVNVLDYNSTNGTYHNGTRVEDSATLQPGDLLTLGNFDLSLRTALRARHAKRIIHPFSIDMNGLGGGRSSTPTPAVKPEPPKAPKKELSLPIKDGAIRYKKADSSRGQTWTVALPRFFSKK